MLKSYHIHNNDPRDPSSKLPQILLMIRRYSKSSSSGMPKMAIDGLVSQPPECMIFADYRGSGAWDVVNILCSNYYTCFGHTFQGRDRN
jgi:hypothetical protein